MNIFKSDKYSILKHIPFTLILILASILRLINLGYSDFQGDEIKALFLPEAGQSISDFLLTQRKGPIQFLVTYLLKIIDPSYSHEFLIRLPFALAGILAVYFFYKFIRSEFNERLAFYASFFLATNGFFVAFSRIVQYQSFVILFMIMALYYFGLASKDKSYNYKGLYLGFVFWALSVLSHYDGVFIAPYVLYLLFRWSKLQVFNFREVYGKFTLTKPIKHLLLSGFIALVLVLIFYVPFVFNIDPGTKSYWQGRLSGTGGKISSSRYLFSVYQPIYVVHIYTLLFVFGFVESIRRFIGVEMLLSIFKAKFRVWATIVLLLVKDYFQKLVALNLWFLIPFIFMEALVNIPGTHIYTYLLPLFIYLGLGILLIEKLAYMLFRHISYVISFAGVSVIFAFIFLQSYVIFVDHAVEYPWTSEKFFIWEFPEPTPVFHLSMFGFPYYRHWEEIGDFVENGEAYIPCPANKEFTECPFKLAKVRYYSTNERSSMSRYHISFNKDTDSAGYYVYIRNPQSFTNEILSDKAAYWAENYEPAKSFVHCPEDVSTGNFRDLLGLHIGECKSEGKEISKIYYMVPGELDSVKEAGF